MGVYVCVFVGVITMRKDAMDFKKRQGIQQNFEEAKGK